MRILKKIDGHNKKNDKPVLGYILKGYPRISETFISNEILLLESYGFKIVIFPMRHPRESFCHESVKRIQAEVHYLPSHFLNDFFKLILPNIALALKSPKRYGHAISVAAKRFARTKKPATFKHFFQAGFMVNNHIIKNDAVQLDHLHGHFAHSPTSVTMFASLLSGLSFSFTAHAKDIYTSNKEQLREKIEKALFVVTCTRYNAEYLQKIAGPSDTPIHCIYHGVDTGLFRSQGARENCTPPYTLLTIARLTEKKGLPLLYKALANLKTQGIEFHHTLIGDGDDRNKILDLINDLDLTDNCVWLGTQTHEEVLRHFQKCDLFLLSSRVAADGDRDGIPNVLVESLAMGVPAISTEVSAIPELIRHRHTGLIVPPDNSEAITDAIISLLNDATLRSKCIKEGRKLVLAQYDNGRLTAKLADIFTGHVAALKTER